MPRYTFKYIDTEDEFEITMPYDELKEFKEQNPFLEQIIVFPSLHSGRGMGKPPDSFRDILREVKKKHSKGLSKSSVNTFN